MSYIYDPLLGAQLVPASSSGGGNVSGPGSSTVGDIAVWNNTSGTLLADSGVKFPIPPSEGGTGIANNNASTITILGNHAATFTLTGATGVTFPTSGTLATTSQLPSFPISPANGGTGIANNNASTLTILGNYASTFTLTGATGVTFPTSGTLATTSQLPTLPISLANGGTNAALTASNGGIFYSTSTAGAILGISTIYGAQLCVLDSGLPSWDKVAGSEDVLIIKEDFIGQISSGVNTAGIWVSARNNSSCNIFQNGTTANPGVWNIQTSTNNNDQIGFILGGNNSSGNEAGAIYLGGGFHRFQFYVQIPTLSSGGDTYKLWFGLGDQLSAYASPPGDYSVTFTYDSSTSLNWLYSTSNSNTFTTNDSGIAVNTSYTLFQIDINAAATLVTYYINGVSVGTIATNIPTLFLGCGMFLEKTAGTNVRGVNIDYFSWYHKLTTPRF